MPVRRLAVVAGQRQAKSYNLERILMLVLSRFTNESIRIDLRQLIPMIAASPETLASILSQPIEVTVVDVRDVKVRLGIDCNKSIPVHRHEVFSKIETERGAR
jgi:carbon storage regulator CsrA